MFRCRDCYDFGVTHDRDQVPSCPKCGTEMELIERMLLRNGKPTEEELDPKELRSKVLSQLEKVELESI
ncbi:MAG: hypothetical protein LUQ55_03230 [Methanomassiliicoccales archaeon]|nr:hypothetical protein [Methanomassiliicoccales archaeon]